MARAPAALCVLALGCLAAGIQGATTDAGPQGAESAVLPRRFDFPDEMYGEPSGVFNPASVWHEAQGWVTMFRWDGCFYQTCGIHHTDTKVGSVTLDIGTKVVLQGLEQHPCCYVCRAVSKSQILPVALCTYSSSNPTCISMQAVPPNNPHQPNIITAKPFSPPQKFRTLHLIIFKKFAAPGGCTGH